MISIYKKLSIAFINIVSTKKSYAITHFSVLLNVNSHEFILRKFLRAKKEITNIQNE